MDILRPTSALSIIAERERDTETKTECGGREKERETGNVGHSERWTF